MKLIYKLRRQYKVAVKNIEISQQRITAKPNSRKVFAYNSKRLIKLRDHIKDVKSQIEAVLAETPQLTIEKGNIVKKIVGDFYRVEIDKFSPFRTATNIEKPGLIMSYLLVTYFKGVAQMKIGQVVGRKRTAVSYGYRRIVALMKKDSKTKIEVFILSKRISTALNMEFIRPEGMDEPQVFEIHNVRSASEMPTNVNRWLKPLAKNNLKERELSKPKYF